ncbi:MAG: short-chain dehydrogenase, partial [Proteobacteria bacterium]|nr:short-chain dehydrogenase [Pseudomonadota bacterium]
MSAASSVRPVVLVTGAARRIGRAIALDLAAHGHDIA